MKKDTNKINFILFFLIFIGVIIRIYSMFNRDIYVDESYYLDVAKINSFFSILKVDHWIKNHGILTILFLKLSQLLTNNLTLLRLPNIIVYLFINYFIIRLFKRFNFNLAAIVFVFFHTLSPYFIFLQSMVSPFNYCSMFVVWAFVQIMFLIQDKKADINKIISTAAVITIAWYFDYSAYYIYLLLLTVFLWALITKKELVKTILNIITLSVVGISTSILYIIVNFAKIAEFHPKETFILSLSQYFIEITNMMFLRLDRGIFIYLSPIFFIFIMVFLLKISNDGVKNNFKNQTILIVINILVTMIFIFIFSRVVFSIYTERSFWYLYILNFIVFSLLLNFLTSNFKKIIFFMFFSFLVFNNFFYVSAKTYPGMIPDFTYKAEDAYIKTKNIIGESKINIFYLDYDDNISNGIKHYFSKITKKEVKENELLIQDKKSYFVLIAIQDDYNFKEIKALLSQYYTKLIIFKSSCTKLNCVFIKDN